MCTNIGNIADLFNCGTRLISGYLIPVIFALALVMFIWGVVNFFIISAGEEAKRTQGKQFMLWGIIAFVVISSVWALVGILGSTFGLGGNTRFLPGAENPYEKGINSTTSNTGGNTGGGNSGGGTGGGGGQCTPACVSPKFCFRGSCLSPADPPGGECTENVHCDFRNPPRSICERGKCVPQP